MSAAQTRQLGRVAPGGHSGGGGVDGGESGAWRCEVDMGVAGTARRACDAVRAACHGQRRWRPRPGPAWRTTLVAEMIEQDQTTWLQRLRSAVLLIVLVCVLGALTAGILGVLIVVGTSLFDQALG